MEKTRKERRLVLIERAERRIESINNDYVFKADFKCARILKDMILEIRILAYENNKYKKILEHNRLYLTKLEKKIK